MLEEDKIDAGMTGAERMVRHGEIKQLREAKRNHQKEVGFNFKILYCDIYLYFIGLYVLFQFRFDWCKMFDIGF